MPDCLYSCFSVDNYIVMVCFSWGSQAEELNWDRDRRTRRRDAWRGLMFNGSEVIQLQVVWTNWPSSTPATTGETDSRGHRELQPWLSVSPVVAGLGDGRRSRRLQVDNLTPLNISPRQASRWRHSIDLGSSSFDWLRSSDAVRSEEEPRGRHVRHLHR